jgi:hypothetical protein
MSDFRPRDGEDSYPLSRLILDRAAELGLTRSDLVARLGYVNSSKGHRVLTQALHSGSVTPFVLKRLATALEIDQSEVDKTLAATAKQHQAEEDERRMEAERAYYEAFRPYLRVECERTVPQPVFVAAMIGVGKLRVVPVDMRVWRSRPLLRDRLVKEAILRHYPRRDGTVIAYGRIIGYSLVLAPSVCFRDLALPYDIHGNPTGPMRAVPRLGSATISVKGKPFPTSTLNEYAKSARTDSAE